MKTFFILGRNPELSREEVLAYLRARNREHKEVLFEGNLLVLETREDERFDIQEFGGVLKLGKVLFEGEEKGLGEFVKNNELVPADKFTFGAFGNMDLEVLKEKFKQGRKKAVLKHGRKGIKMQEGERLELPTADFYIFFHTFEDEIYFGLVTQDYNYMKVKERDMNKPVRREQLAISPRLSKILINLSGAKPRDLLLDPFCGVGGILQEALIKKMNVHGIDKDKQATIDAAKNLKWVASKYGVKNNYKIENLDSRKAPDLQFAAIATETPLGKILRKKPNDNEAKQIIQNFEAYMIPILSKLKNVKKPNAKIAITFPVIRDFHVDTPKIASKTGLKVIMRPILESRSDQFISRDIIVFQ